MTRATNTPSTRRRRKKIIKQAKGYFGSKHKLFKTAKEQVMRSSVYSFRDRKQRKRDFRRLWISRINSACKKRKDLSISYSRLMNLLKLSQIKLDRKQLSEIASNSPGTFNALLEKVTKNPWL